MHYEGEGARKPAREIVQELARVPPRELACQRVRELGREPVQEHALEHAQEHAQDLARDLAQHGNLHKDFTHKKKKTFTITCHLALLQLLHGGREDARQARQELLHLPQLPQHHERRRGHPPGTLQSN